MNTTPEERAEMRANHRPTRIGTCWSGEKPFPCLTVRLLDDADEADALRARAEAAEARGEWAWQLAQSMVPPEALKVAEQQVEAAEADNAALREALAWIEAHETNDTEFGCRRCRNYAREILAQPHPGDALRERLRLAEKALTEITNVGELGPSSWLPEHFDHTSAPLMQEIACNALGLPHPADAAREAKDG